MLDAIGEGQARIVSGVVLLVRVDWMGVLADAVRPAVPTDVVRPIADRLMREELRRRAGDSIDRRGVLWLARDVASAVARELARGVAGVRGVAPSRRHTPA
jgi:hypothetical protein